MAARSWLRVQLARRRSSAKLFLSTATNGAKLQQEIGIEDDVPTAGISRPLSHILKDLNKKIPESLLKLRHEPAGAKYIPWCFLVTLCKTLYHAYLSVYILNRILNLYAPEWSGEVRSITHSAEGKLVSVVYRVTLYGTDAEIFRESTGTAPIGETGYTDAMEKAESMAFRRACARFGLGLYLFHHDLD
ncbi:cobalt ion binding [Striga asiatica]|uniref:Cobalt ion binding n=1 Tax=Striga asiatica TaxID=4170 RepID=A0A5A7P4V5_STRAF|nr:cobalt ion binding [Striga asiatica]